MAADGFQLTPRDVRILGDLADVGVLDLAAIHARHFPNDRSGHACARRVRLMVCHHLIGATPLTIVIERPNGGRPSHVYRLAQHGADVLSELAGKSATVSTKDPRPETILHRIGIAKVRLAVTDACKLQSIPSPAWIGEFDTVPGAKPDARLPDRFRLCERYPAKDNTFATCWADASCWIKVPVPASSAPANLLVYWEFDRSSETLKQVAAKLPGYSRLHATRGYEKHWPEAKSPTVRVFFVVPSEMRLNNISSAIRSLPGADIVRLAMIDEVASKTVLTDAVWRTVSGERRSILRNSSWRN